MPSKTDRAPEISGHIEYAGYPLYRAYCYISTCPFHTDWGETHGIIKNLKLLKDSLDEPEPVTVNNCLVGQSGYTIILSFLETTSGTCRLIKM